MLTSIFRNVGHYLINQCVGAGYGVWLLVRTVPEIPFIFKKRHELLQQMYLCGVKSFAVTMVVAVFTGMILSLQTGLELSKLGQQELIGNLVVIVMTREMGPFITGLILAACVGSAMAAELGTMTVSEEIDALELMSINPVRFLVLPRILAMILMCPAMTAFTDVVGIIGGGIVAQAQLAVDSMIYSTSGIDALRFQPTVLMMPKDLFVGFVKSFVFGLIIATVGCSQGLRAKQGAMGVGQAARAAVIQSFLLVIISSYYMTWFFNKFINLEDL